MVSIREALSRVSYPGRGIVLGLHENGEQAVLLYFIMGRSENSRNRVFVTDGTGIRTEAFDAAKMKDPSLIIYRPVCTCGRNTIVTNGDQTDTVCEALTAHGEEKEGLSFYRSVHLFDKALRTREYEPDAPNYTPRISGIAHIEEGRYGYALNILKADKKPQAVEAATEGGEQEAPSCLRFTYVYEKPYAGCGHFLHTYEGDGTPLPSFTGEPERLAVSGSLAEITKEAWDALDADNRVSLFVRFITLRDGTVEEQIVNANRQE